MLWHNIGEARAKCRQLSTTPLPPPVAEETRRVYLAKGARATTAIEGNTLTEEQAVAAVEGALSLPASQQYLERELKNIIEAIHDIVGGIDAGDPFAITPQRLKDLNRRVLDGLELEDHVAAGEYRTGSVLVGGVYRGAPARDREDLVEELCEWLNGPDFAPDGDSGPKDFRVAFLKAVVAHIYLAWIQPFGGCNGRTARLIEFGVLTAAGVPSVAAHLLSNHYNATRNRYYQQLEYVAKSGGDICRFAAYAAEGFVDELQQQLDHVQGSIMEAAWRDYVNGVFHNATTITKRRQRDLVLALPSTRFMPRANVRTLTPELADAYAGKQAKTISRDLNRLVELGLIKRNRGVVRARREIMLPFLARVVPGVDDDQPAPFLRPPSSVV
jgi:Fic family protein